MRSSRERKRAGGRPGRYTATTSRLHCTAACHAARDNTSACQVLHMPASCCQSHGHAHIADLT